MSVYKLIKRAKSVKWKAKQSSTFVTMINIKCKTQVVRYSKSKPKLLLIRRVVLAANNYIIAVLSVLLGVVSISLV